MATYAKRKEALEALTIEELKALGRAGKWHHDNNLGGRIVEILNGTEKRGDGDALDRLLSLPTDAEQQLELQRDMVDATKSSSRASWVSARAALISTVCAVLAVVISVLALWAALQD